MRENHLNQFHLQNRWKVQLLFNKKRIPFISTVKKKKQFLDNGLNLEMTIDKLSIYKTNEDQCGSLELNFKSSNMNNLQRFHNIFFP